MRNFVKAVLLKWKKCVTPLALVKGDLHPILCMHVVLNCIYFSVNKCVVISIVAA